MYDLTAVLRDVLVPVLAQLLRPGELERVDLRQDDSTVWAELTLRGEVAHLWVWTGENALSDAALRARMASDLQDFIAESTFAWGQWRDYVEG